MNSRWWWRAGSFIAALLLAVYILVPTFFNFNATREKVANEGGAIPEYFRFFPEKQVKLGLDLQGGIHLVLGVDVEKAMQDRMQVFSNDIQENLKEEKYPAEKITVFQEENAILVSFPGEITDKPEDIKRYNEVRKFLRERFSIFHVVPEKDTFAVKMILKKEESRYLRRNAVEQALQVLRNRIDEFGVNEPTISAQGDDRILVQLPGVKDPARAKELIGKTAQLSFKMVDDTTPVLDPLIADPKNIPEGISVDYERLYGKDGQPFDRPFLRGMDRKPLTDFLEGKIPDTHVVHLEESTDKKTLNKTYRTYVLENRVLLTGDRVEDARQQVNPQNNRPEVGFTLDFRGGEIFKKVTTDHVQERLAIILDNNIVSAPNIKEPILGGRGSISFGDFLDASQLAQEAQDLALVLRAGSLQAPVSILEDRTIGATLGADYIRRGTQAMGIGALLVILFMAVYYKVSGLIADLALIVNGLFILACLVFFQATLTLPGMAGIILTVGMAVDANVIIFERIREELRSGKDPQSSVFSGYERAWWTVFDANITTAIAGIVLMQYGTGPIKGFAVTLLIGILFSFITAVYGTRILFDRWIENEQLEKLSI